MAISCVFKHPTPADPNHLMSLQLRLYTQNHIRICYDCAPLCVLLLSISRLHLTHSPAHWCVYLLGSLLLSESVRMSCLLDPLFHLRYALRYVKHTLVGHYYHLEPLSLDEICEIFISSDYLLVIFVKIWYSRWGKISPHGYTSWGENSPRGPLNPTRFEAKCHPPGFTYQLTHHPSMCTFTNSCHLSMGVPSSFPISSSLCFRSSGLFY